MSSGAQINIAVGIEGSQLGIEQYSSQLIALANEKKVEIDFFVAPNGKVLPSTFKSWMGINRREKLLKRAKDERLKNAINQLYRPGSIIGDGGTASVIKFERRTGIGLGKNGNSHIQKGKEMIVYLERKIISQDNIGKCDKKMAKKLVKALKKSIWG